MSRKPLFVIYPNQRITPELWAEFLEVCQREGLPAGVKLYQLIAQAVRELRAPKVGS